MVLTCAVVNCGSRGGRDQKSFFSFPQVSRSPRYSDKRKKLAAERREKWFRALMRADLEDKKLEYFRICSDHFISGAPSKLTDVDNPDWAPSINLGHDYFDADRKLKKRKDETYHKGQYLCDAYNMDEKCQRKKVKSSEKNIICRKTTSPINTAVSSMERIESETPISSSETVMSSCESEAFHTSNPSASVKATIQVLMSVKCSSPHNYCRFKGCRNTEGNGIHMHRFPKDEKQCKAWVKASKNKALIGFSASDLYRHFRICTSHFEDWCFMDINSKSQLVHNAIPCCSKERAVKILAPDKIQNISGVPTVINDSANESSVLKQFLIFPVSSQASNTLSEETNIDFPMRTSQYGDASVITVSESSSDSEENNSVSNTLGNSTISQLFLSEEPHIKTIQLEGVSATNFSPEKDKSEGMILKSVNIENTFVDDDSSENMQENDSSENNVQFVENVYRNSFAVPTNSGETEDFNCVSHAEANSFAVPTNSGETEDINCISHAEAFSAAKTLLHYLMNQNDVDSPDINFILNLIRKIERRLKKENISGNS